jgi:glycosyltransferase involved in cell wall biosynthesis
MRIAYDHQIFGWQKYGGIARYFYELARGVALTAGFEATIVAPLYVNQYLGNRPDALRLIGRQVPSAPRSGRIYRALNSLIVGRLLKGIEPHIVHETYYSTRRLAPARSKVVLTVFDMVQEKFPGQYSFLDPISREKAAAAARADHIICISESTRRDLIDILHVPRDKTSVVHLGSEIRQPSAAVRTTTGRPFLLYVGARGGYKNFLGLLSAYARSPLMRGFDLVCFGGGPLKPSELRRISELKIPGDRVRQMGGNDGILASLYGAASVLVYPSLYEGFGIPPLEAMSIGCPVVCCNSSSLPEVVGSAAQFFDPSDPDGLLSAIETVLTSESRRTELVSLGRERSALFSWERMTRETLATYQKIGLA